jgi:alpha-tubulin suppressor-like RCC1 family protein
MVKVKYRAACPFCNTQHESEIEMSYRKDLKFNVRKQNKSEHTCSNIKCGREFIVEIDSQGSVMSMPTKEAEKEGIFAWERLVEGKIIRKEDN